MCRRFIEGLFSGKFPLLVLYFHTSNEYFTNFDEDVPARLLKLPSSCLEEKSRQKFCFDFFGLRNFIEMISKFSEIFFDFFEVLYGRAIKNWTTLRVKKYALEVNIFLELVFTFYSLSELEWQKFRYLTNIFQHSCRKRIRRFQLVVVRINVFCEKTFIFIVSFDWTILCS